MQKRLIAGSVALLALAAGLAVEVAAQKTTGPKARYQMDVTTASGMPGMAGMGGGGGAGAKPRGGLGAMFGGGGMSAMMGGGGPRHELELRLGSTLAASGTPAADHFVPAGLGLGPSVPLATPVATASPPVERGDVPRDFQRPKGRMLIFWGCGAKAGPGQPVVIDFAKMAAGQVPPGLFSANVPVDRGVTQGNSRTYGYWPNDRGRRVDIPGNSSLVGPHRIAGNYSPEIKFALNQDFMNPLQVRTAEMGNVTNVSWNAIPAATGYYAHGIGFSGGGKRGGSNDIVWWTSASRQEFFGGLTDWLAPSVVQRLIGERVVMPPTQTQCQIPAEVKAAGGEMMMLSMYAYGPEASFAFPPRPANPKIAWNPEWTARVRYRSVSNKIVGMPDMDEAMSGRDGSDEPRQPQKKCGMLQRAAGLC
ncbi:hypothetical protein [Sphingomonas sp. SUN039]|uniref:hypothetical protein n=1 Tax=Sphingomonas sp. SUN039 TaxID=2937787 RepID=UPI0021647CE6|nr:hypothetical protein [Sphingomonas sp. SUN039]UVO55650.1 hypothetical protein M0209_16570 [Sphingomonas sp. SUN039]